MDDFIKYMLAILALITQAVGVMIYFNKRFKDVEDKAAAAIAEVVKTMGQEIEKLHGRVNNVRNGFVEKEQYRIDVANFMQSSREILTAIERNAEVFRARLRDSENTDVKHGTLIDRLQADVKELETDARQERRSVPRPAAGHQQ